MARVAAAFPNSKPDKMTMQIYFELLGDIPADELKYAVDWNVAANERRDQLISCEIQEGSTEELLAGVLTPAGLTYSLDGTQLTILLAE